MKTTLKFLAAAVVLSLSSCVVHRTVVVEQAPAPTYTQAPPPVSEPAPQQQPYQQPAPQQVYQQPAPQQQAAPAGYDQFYNQLSPYGQWVNYPAYGYVWVPNEGPGFQPYSTAGHWIYSNYGWTWASDYSWGWAPFHYGRWQYDGYYGWFWIPGNEWAPAWVCWRNCNGYYGWAPLGYGDYTSVNYNSPYYTNSNIWVFVPQRHMCEQNVSNYYEPRERYNGYIQNSTAISSTAGSNPAMRSNAGSSNNYYSGPPRSEVESYTGAPIRQVTVGSSSNPGQGHEENGNYNIYHPQVVQNNSNNTEHAVPVKPTNVVDIHSLPPATQRPKTNAPPQPLNNSNEQPKEEMKPVNNNAPQPKQTQSQEVRPVNTNIEQPKQQAPPQENKPVNNTVQQQPKQAPSQQQPKNNQPKANKPPKTQPKQQQSKSAPPVRKDN